MHGHWVRVSSRKISLGGKLWASEASLEFFCSNHTHFSNYTHFSHAQITRSCTRHADHSSAQCLPHGVVLTMKRFLIRGPRASTSDEDSDEELDTSKRPCVDFGSNCVNVYRRTKTIK